MWVVGRGRWDLDGVQLSVRGWALPCELGVDGEAAEAAVARAVMTRR